ncbi:unnamed protein product, partial [Didymodactylos carnosus]
MKFSRSKGRHVPNFKRGYFVPFLDSLKNILSLPEMFNIITNDVLSKVSLKNDLKTDIFHGDFCQNHTIFKEKSSLKIVLYYDDIGITNPLGTRKRGVGMFYYTLCNIPRFLRSQDRSIHLVACADKADINEFGIQRLLKDFIDSINILQESGIEIELTNSNSSIIDATTITISKTMVLKGSLLVIVGDLLSLAGIHGFKMGFRHALKPCFLCNIDNTDLNTISAIDTCQHRTMSAYLTQCTEIENARTNEERDVLCKKFGINHRSIFTKIKNFDIFEQTALDVMHLFLEGICKKQLTLFFTSVSEGVVWDRRHSWTSICPAIAEFRYPTADEAPSSPTMVTVNGIVIIDGFPERFLDECVSVADLKQKLINEFNLNENDGRVLLYFDEFVKEYCVLRKLDSLYTAPPQKLSFEKLPNTITQVYLEAEGGTQIKTTAPAITTEAPSGENIVAATNMLLNKSSVDIVSAWENEEGEITSLDPDVDDSNSCTTKQPVKRESNEALFRQRLAKAIRNDRFQQRLKMKKSSGAQWDDRHQAAADEEKENEQDDKGNEEQDEAELEKYVKALNELFNDGIYSSNKNRFKQLIISSYHLRAKHVSNNNILFRDMIKNMPFTKTLDFVKAEFEVRTQSTVAKTSQNILKLFDKLKILYPDVDHSQMPDDTKKSFDETFDKMCSQQPNTFTVVYLKINDDEYDFYLIYSNLLKFDLTGSTIAVMCAVFLAAFYSFDLGFLTKQKPVAD